MATIILMRSLSASLHDKTKAINVVMFALAREAKPFLKRYPNFRRIENPPHPAWEVNRSSASGRDNLLILVTGVGTSSTLSALEWISRFPPASITVAGFCGALTPASKVADVLRFGEVIDESANIHPCGESGPRLLTSSRMIADPAEKQRLAERYGACAVDMESAGAVRWCNERGVLVQVIRSVSDEAETRLSPRLLQLLSGGKPSLLKVIGQLVRSPRLLPELLRLAKHTRLAAQKLADELVASTKTAD